MKNGSWYYSLEIITQEVKHTRILHSSFYILHLKKLSLVLLISGKEIS